MTCSPPTPRCGCRRAVGSGSPTSRRSSSGGTASTRNLTKVADLGFDDTFVRMWNFYLAYSQAGFAAEYLDDWQLGIGRP